MAALAVPLIEAVGIRVLAALGVGVAAGAAGEAAREAARRRQAEADKAKTAPIARTDAQTTTKEKCKECPPDRGTPKRRTFPTRHDWVNYQARIGGMPNGPTYIDEWVFNGREFDGFVSAECLLKEAKGGYDQFFDEWGRPKKWWTSNVVGMIEQIGSQSVVAMPRPPIRLEWFWQEPLSYRYFSKILVPIASDVPHHYFP